MDYIAIRRKFVPHRYLKDEDLALTRNSILNVMFDTASKLS